MATIVVITAGISIWIGFELRYLPLRSFDSESWKQASYSESNPRPQMADSLIFWDQLDGMTRDEVFVMLGPPSEGGYFSEFGTVYWLGPERGVLSVDSEWLVIAFDENDRVASYEIMRD